MTSRAKLDLDSVQFEKGFVDELIDADNTTEIAATADRSAIIVAGNTLPLLGLSAPDSIPTGKSPVEAKEQTETPAAAGVFNKQNENGGKTVMANNFAELRAENPELASGIELEFDAKQKEAVAAERKRISEIEEIAALYDDELVKEAKYGETACDARELAFRGAKAAAKAGGAFLTALDNEYRNSGAGKVDAAAAPQDAPEEKPLTNKDIDDMVDELFDEEGE